MYSVFLFFKSVDVELISNYLIPWNMKKIALIGASGFVGSALLNESLQRGHQVTARVRHPEKITLVHPNLIVMQGDVMSVDTVEKLVRGADVVISAYNPG